MLSDKGCLWSWFFHYVPIGENPDVDLVPDAKQRQQILKAVYNARNTLPMMTVDFWGDGPEMMGCIAGGIGMGLFDLLSGWTLWAPFTLIIVGLMGFTVGAISEKKSGFGWNCVALLAALGIKIVGYYIAEGIIYGNWVAPAASIPGNIVQICVAAVIVLVVIGQLRAIAFRTIAHA